MRLGFVTAMLALVAVPTGTPGAVSRNRAVVRAAALSRPDLMDRRLREAGKRALHKGFMVGQRLGVDLLPRHY